MKQLATLIFITLLGTAFGQKITKAVSQDWAGGISSATGTNYTVTLKFKINPNKIEVKQVWLAGKGKLKGVISKNSSAANEYYVSFGITQNNLPYDEIHIKDLEPEKQREENHEAREIGPVYEGVALLVLEINGKRKEIVVDSFENLMMLAYP